MKDVLDRIKDLERKVRCCVKNNGGGSGDGIQSIQEGDNITIDNTDPLNPIISASGGSEGDFMTLNSENEVTEDWNINYYREAWDTKSTLTFDESGIYGTTQSDTYEERNGSFSLGSETFGFGTNSRGGIGLYPESIHAFWEGDDKSVQLYFPNNDASGIVIPISVNGNYADEYGNIEIETGGGQEFVAITESGRRGWGLKYRADNPARYGDIGLNSIDLSYSGSNSAVRGALGSYSVALGWNNSVIANGSSILGGTNNKIETTMSSDNSVIIGGDGNSILTGTASTILGGSFNNVTGNYAAASGMSNTAHSMGEFVVGTYATDYTPSSKTARVLTDRVFNIGNGIAGTRSDAFTILKNGLATLPSVTNALIDAEPTGKAVVTKEWVLTNSGGGLTLEQARQNGNNVNGDISLTKTSLPGSGELTLSAEGLSKTMFGTTSNLNFTPTTAELISSNSGGGISSLSLYGYELILENKDVGTNFGRILINPIDGVVVETNLDFRGGDYTPSNYTDNSYTQKKYVDDFYTTISGYDAGETQTLKHVNGVLTWVTD